MTSEDTKKGSGGILTKLKVLLDRNRLGEMMVLKGLLTPGELRRALATQKATNAHLGRVLVEQNMVTRGALYRTLTQQWTLRCMAAALGIFITFSSMGIKNARAASIKDVPAQMSIVSAAFNPVSSYPALFGTEERRSGNIGPFTKWSGMFARFETAMYQPSGKEIITTWQNQIRGYQGLPLNEMAQRVNSYINKKPYILDNRNWGQSDYWASPIEFFQRGGDCEDFAIAKYASLRALGVPEDRMRVAIVHDLQKDIPHAVLIVYTDTGALILDNQNEKAEDARRITRYKPIFSINRNAWWLHTKPTNTIVASAD